MDKQAVFDKVTNHLLTQKDAALEGRKCQYRTRDGKKCAIGVLIEDRFYYSGIEGPGVFNSLVLEVVEKSLGLKLTADDLTFLSGLQHIHDAEPAAWWAECLKVFAKLHNVSFNFPHQPTCTSLPD